MRIPRIDLLLSVLFLLFSFSLRAQDSKKAASWYAKGIDVLARDKQDSALYCFSRSILADSIYLPAYKQRADIYFTKEKYYDAELDYAFLLKKGKITADTYFKLGRISELSRLFDQAMNLYTRAITMNPADGSYYYYRGKLFIQQEKYLKGAVDLQKADSLHYTGEDMYWQLGDALIKIKQFKQATLYLSKAIERTPENDTLYASRGYAFLESRQFDLAEEDLHHFLLAHPTDIITLYHLGRTYAALGKYDESVNAFEKVVALQPGYYDSWFRLGLAQAGKSDFSSAIDAFSKAIEEYPDQGYLYYNRGIARGRITPQQDFCSDFQKAAALGDKDAESMIKRFCTSPSGK